MEHQFASWMQRGAVAVALASSLGGCFLPEDSPIYGSRAPEPAAAATVSNLRPDSRGVIGYASYQVAVVGQGDTISSVAERVGVAPDELARLNGLPLTYPLRAGERLVLPDSVARGAPGEITASPLGWTPEVAAAAIDNAPAATGTAAADNPFGNGQTDPLIDPVRHRVEPGETAYSIARLYGVSVTALASWNGLGPDLAVRSNQELLIPIVSGANQIASTPPDSLPGEGTLVAAPPSATAPLPENIVAEATPASPELGQFRTPPGGRLQAPVSGPVTKRYNPGSGPGASEGIGFSVPAGTPVRAAGEGEIALVSESLGGLGTIVLIRHADDLITVYGRVDDVAVERGQRVTAGQTIGVVAARDNPELHFEVRRGTDSVDPAPYLGG